MVMCLSEHVRNDTLLDKPHRIPKACRNQLKFELLQRVSLHLTVVIFTLCSASNNWILELLKKRNYVLETLLTSAGQACNTTFYISICQMLLLA